MRILFTLLSCPSYLMFMLRGMCTWCLRAMMSTIAATAKSLETSSSKPVLTFVTGNPKKLEEVRNLFGTGMNDFLL